MTGYNERVGSSDELPTPAEILKRKPRILIVEDDIELSPVLEMGLTAFLKAECTVVDNVKSALEASRTQKANDAAFDIIVSDLGIFQDSPCMSGISLRTVNDEGGYEVAKVIHDSPELHGEPLFILWTGRVERVKDKYTPEQLGGMGIHEVLLKSAGGLSALKNNISRSFAKHIGMNKS